jgi:hypothetical protein
MTNDEALNFRSYSHYCTCGGSSKPLSVKHPHQSYCPQAEEHTEWIEALDRMNMTVDQALAHIFPKLYS